MRTFDWLLSCNSLSNHQSTGILGLVRDIKVLLQTVTDRLATPLQSNTHCTHTSIPWKVPQFCQLPSGMVHSVSVQSFHQIEIDRMEQ